MTAFYNEIDKYAAQWLRNLIAAGHIAPGVVDERDIRDIKPDELVGFTQCHFFAGIGVWSHALRRAGWPDDRPVWTGSCPCQPFSAAGQGGGFADERHLWPAFHHLIRERRPRCVFGEQVASKDGLAWFDLVQADLEGEAYAVGARDLCAAGFGAPHIRQRLWFVADAGARVYAAGEQARLSGQPRERRAADPVELALSEHGGRQGRDEDRPRSGPDVPPGEAGALAHHHPAGLGEQRRLRLRGPEVHDADGRGPTSGHWSDADWIYCRDGKYRPVEPGTFPLAHGAPARVGRLRAYGNAVVAEVATEFIAAYLGRDAGVTA